MPDKLETYRVPEQMASAPPHATRRGIASRTRPQVRGKFLFTGEQKLYLRGVTYGTFCPSPDGDQYPPLEVMRADFSAMAANGINAIRTYTVPPEWLLDQAAEFDIYVMVGLPWEQHIAFLDE